MMRKPPNVPFVGAQHVGGSQRPTAIYITLSETTSDSGSALAIAKYLHGRTAPLKSHHYILDESRTYRCVPDFRQAYGTFHHSVSVHICAQIHEDIPLWTDDELSPAMKRAAKLVAELVLYHKIRLRYVDTDGEAYVKWRRHRWRRRGGIIVNVLGSWPYDLFMDEVHAELGKLKARKD